MLRVFQPVVFGVVLGWAAPSEPADPATPYCLSATSAGEEGIPAAGPCQGDLARIGENDLVRAVMKAFDLTSDQVSFQACPRGRYMAIPNINGPHRYLVRYPSEPGMNFLAPIAHELGHVVQMRDAGGLSALDPRNNSRRIELGADFLAGLAFGIALKELSQDDFESNLQLAGSYKVAATDFHGLPHHRSTAFLRGRTRAYPYADLGVSDSLKYWYANDLPRIVR